MPASTPLLSAVEPVYLASSVLTELLRRLHAVLLPITPAFELPLVDDGSPNASEWDTYSWGGLSTKVPAVLDALGNCLSLTG